MAGNEGFPLGTGPLGTGALGTGPLGTGRLRIARQGAFAVVVALLLGSCALRPGEEAGTGETGRTGPAASDGKLPVRIEPSAAEVRAEEMNGGGGQGARPGHEEALLDTYWKLLEVRGRPVVVGEQQREPHLILHGAQNRVTVQGGCNRLAGSYELAGEHLTFGGLAGTKMACREGLQDEARFVAALAASAAWRIAGRYLDLFDAGGAPVARFEVRHL